MEVLIVSKTRMGNAACVGGLVLANNQYVRLLNPGNQNQPTNTDFEVGDIWELTFVNRLPILPPHIEDVIITNRTFIVKKNNLAQFLPNLNIVDWVGPIHNLFNGLLEWTNGGAGHIPINGILPNKSVGFAILDRDLAQSIFQGKIKYTYPQPLGYRNIPYVGFQEPIAIIPAGTLIRVSLARAYPPLNSPIAVPRGYYLQLSGWYMN